MLGYMRHLANYARIVEAGSVTGAANRAQISPSQMSESLKVIETYFGAPLVERHAQGVRPNSLGTAIYEDAARMLAAAERALDPGARQSAGPVRVSVPEELAAGALRPAWSDMLTWTPAPDIKIFCEDQKVDVERFSRDVFVRVSHKDPPPGLNVLETAAFGVGLFGTPKVVEALGPETVLICAPRSGAGAEIGEAGPDQLTFQRTLQVSAIQTRVALARQGFGLIRCLDVTFAEDVARGTMAEVGPAYRIGGVRAHIGTPHARPAEHIRAVCAAIAKALNP